MLLRTLRRLPAVGRFAAVRLAVRTGTPRLRELRPDGLGRAARPIAGGLAVLLAAQAAQAQYFGGYNGGCSSCQTTPVVQAASCAPPPTCAVAAPVCQTAMVVQPCMQRVAVTEMQPEERTVMRPVCETRYVDQTVTEYRPVVETKTIDQPVTTYQPVTEYQTVTRDQGSWQTHYVCNQRCSPCQYDGRPGFMGWMNRTGYEMRSAFTPKYTACRTYQPNVVSQQVPVTRQVAVQGTRQVTYNVTRYEPQQTTRKVAVNETRMVAEKITVNRPVTVYRDVPVGTSIAYAPMGGSTVAFGGGVVSNVAYGPISYGGTTTALAPSPDPAATAATPIRTRTAEREPLPPRPNPGAEPFSRGKPGDGAFGPPPATAPGAETPVRLPKFRRLTDADREKLIESRRLARGEDAAAPGLAATQSTFKVPAADAFEMPAERKPAALAAVFGRSSRTPVAAIETDVIETDAVAYRPTSQLPSLVRSVRWTPAKSSFAEGPALLAPSLAAAE